MAEKLHLHPLFQTRAELLPNDERVALSYKRAKLVLQSFPLSPSDVQFCTPRFWALMRHPIMCFEIAMYIILTIHVGLVIGTLSRHVDKRREFKRLVDSLLRFETLGIYQLAERTHGVDSINIETTATKTSDGYIFHSPREEAAKFMPASTSAFGISKLSLVNALLILDGKNLGSRFFVVPICNEHEMYKGVISTRLPPRPGTSPFDWALMNVHLPFSALVSSDAFELSLPSNLREAWWNEVWRVQYGTMYVAAPFISGLKASAYITGQYSLHRTVTSPADKQIPIISFRTQQWPVAEGAAAGLVYEEFSPLPLNLRGTADPRVRHAVIVIIKETIIRHVQRRLPGLAEHLGAQGTLEHNYIPRLANNIKGVVIAEGDILPLCNKVFSELLQGQYRIPIHAPEESFLAQHASSLLEEYAGHFLSLEKLVANSLLRSFFHRRGLLWKLSVMLLRTRLP